MATSTPGDRQLRLPLDEIVVRENVRDLDDAQVDNLALSIALRGLSVGPVKATASRVAGHPACCASRPVGSVIRRAPDDARSRK